MVGLLDSRNPDMRRNALAQGLLSAGSGLLMGSGPSRVPQGLLGGFGQALGGFNQGFQGALRQGREDQLFDLKLGELEAAKAQRESLGNAAANLPGMTGGPEDPPPNVLQLIETYNSAGLPEKAIETYHEWAFTAPDTDAPTVREFYDGDQVTQKQWNPTTMQWEEVGAGPRFSPPASTTVNFPPGQIDYGNPPTDTAWARNPDGTVKLDDRGVPIALPIQGSKAFLAQEAASDAETEQTEQTLTVGNVVLTDIGRARDKIVNAPWYSPATGLLGNILKDVGGTVAADVRALTDTVRANIGFDRLQKMREASPTGGALGQVTERELAQLQAVLGSLEQSQTEDQLVQNLDRLDDIYTDILRKAGAYPNADQFGFSGGGQPAAPANPYAGMTDEQVLEELRKQGYLE